MIIWYGAKKQPEIEELKTEVGELQDAVVELGDIVGEIIVNGEGDANG